MSRKLNNHTIPFAQTVLQNLTEITNMPIPKRGKDEDRNKFMSRCMRDPNAGRIQTGKSKSSCLFTNATEGMNLIQRADFEKQEGIRLCRRN